VRYVVRINPASRETSDTSFVKIENGNMIKLTLKQIAKLYTQYAKIVLEIKELKDKKSEIRSDLFQKVGEIEEGYRALAKLLPQQPEGVKSRLRNVSYPTEKTPEIEFSGDSFVTLRKEFERIRDELENIK
jgi:uncharacterized coiled-coil DUF342 family protein